MASGVDKAAMLMLAIKPETAARIMSVLEEDEIKLISQAMSRLGAVNSELMEQLLSEIEGGDTDNATFIGNVQSTERFLRKVLSKEKVDVILEDIRGPAGRNIWDKLGNVNGDVLANYLKNEYPQTAALIISRLAPEQAADVLSLLSADFAFEVIKRIILMDPVKQEVLDRVEKTLRTEFISGLSKAQKFDNKQLIAEIFNRLNRNDESKFMSMLEQYDNNIADKIKSLMFTFEDIKRIGPNGVQAVLKLCDKNKLPLALKGASEEIRKMFLDNMSQRAAKLLRDEIESMGPVKLKDVDQAQSDIILITKTLIAKGEIDLTSSDDQMVY